MGNEEQFSAVALLFLPERKTATALVWAVAVFGISPKGLFVQAHGVTGDVGSVDHAHHLSVAHNGCLL